MWCLVFSSASAGNPRVPASAMYVLSRSITAWAAPWATGWATPWATG